MKINLKKTVTNAVVLLLWLLNEMVYLLFFPGMTYLASFFIDAVAVSVIGGIISLVFLISWVGFFLDRNSPGTALGQYTTSIILEEVIVLKEDEVVAKPKNYLTGGWMHD